MVRNSPGMARALLLLAISAPAMAQYVTTPQPSQTQPSQAHATSATTRAGELNITPKNGQTQEQQWSDRYECHRWATSQSGFDPTKPSADTSSGDNAPRREQYRRALSACLEGRGYSVSYGAQTTPVPQQPSRLPTTAKQVAPIAPETTRRPLRVQIEGGYTFAAGATDRNLEDGSNIGLGFTFFPISSLPVGLRVDGSYSSFRAKNALLESTAPGFTSGHENIYGGDVDLEFDLAHQSAWSKLYLFGGAGWYREQTHLRQVTFEDGIFCDFFYCGPGFGPVVTAVDRTTSPWHSSWNAGLGWEVSNGAGASFFVEARYLRIAPRNSNLGFVPIRVGLRF
jgi:hypothetical protein